MASVLRKRRSCKDAQEQPGDDQGRYWGDAATNGNTKGCWGPPEAREWQGRIVFLCSQWFMVILYSSPGTLIYHPINFTTGGKQALCLAIASMKMLPHVTQMLSYSLIHLAHRTSGSGSYLWHWPSSLLSPKSSFFKTLLKASALIKLKLWYFRVSFLILY